MLKDLNVHVASFDKFKKWRERDNFKKGLTKKAYLEIYNKILTKHE
jgi:hypothetical protein